MNQLLTAAKLYIENIRHVAEQKEHFIDQSVGLLNKSIQEIRRLSHALVTPTISDSGLRESLLEMIDTYQQLKAFSTHTTFDFDEKHVANGLELTIYRIVQECLNNTVKYAKATEVSVSITLLQKRLQVLYTDNGIGFKPSAVKRGIGLKNIINRAEAYKGKVKISASPGGGFELKVVFPLTGT